jgi:signal transduction histidine kinase
MDSKDKQPTDPPEGSLTRSPRAAAEAESGRSTAKSGKRQRIAELESRVALLEAELAATEERNRLLQEHWGAWISLISHDLRGPLTLILGHAENIQYRLNKGAEAESDRRGLIAIVGAARRLNKMLGQVVDGARLEIGALATQPREIDLVALVDDEVRRFRRAHPHRAVRVRLPDSPPYAFGDPRRVAAIFGSLLSNAVIFSPKGGEIAVDVIASGESVAIRVCDSGIGLDPEEIPHLFERFYRPDHARTLPREGLGMSLAIARDVVQSFGGDLTAVSPGPNLGTCFTLQLPFAPDLPEE